MELYSAEAKGLGVLIKDWFSHPETELEATFGVKGKVDVGTFLDIVGRLKAKGYVAKPQVDRLSIILPDQVRFQINGFGVIQQYCRDDRIVGKPFEAMIKDRTVGQASNLDLEEYNVRIKSRRELPLDKNDPKIQEILSTWGQQKKAFRLIRRWSFEGNGVVFDLSMVRSTPQDMRGQFRWARRFSSFNIVSSAPEYEVEVELLREGATTVDKATQNLIAGLTNVLRGMQKNVLLIRKSARTTILDQYRELVKTDQFRGVAPVTLETQHMMSTIEENESNIRTGYNVTEKADGLRVHAFCDKRGELYMIDMGMNVYRTGLAQPDCKMSLLDGEYVTRDKDNKAIQQLLLFDIYHGPGGEDVTRMPFFEGRHKRLQGWMEMWTHEGGPKIVATGITPRTQTQVAMKKFVFAAGSTEKRDDSIFRAAAQVLDTSYPYYVDGLIFTPNSLPLPQKAGIGFKAQFKWKPVEDNTIDFLVITEKDAETKRVDKVQTSIHPDSGETVSYKILRLFVGSAGEDAVADPRSVVLFEQQGQQQQQQQQGQQQGRQQQQKNEYRPVLFNPKENPDTMASFCYVAVQNDLDTGEQYILTERSKEAIRDRSIVEMAYDPARSPGWRWYPIRVRSDKTERLMKGILARTLNSEKVGESVWNSINDPVTESMIRTGNDEPLQEEISALLKTAGERAEIGKKYYERKAPKQDLIRVRGMRDFHNRWIKDMVLYGPVLKPGGKSILDVAVGKAGDLQRWRRGRAGFVFGVDYSGENIRDADDGAYRRLLDTMRTSPPGTVAPMFFAIGDSSKNLATGEAGATNEERDIMRTILGKAAPEGTVPPLVEKMGAGRLRAGVDVITCMFAIHYFFQTPETFSGFLRNIQENLKLGGYFMGCAFDGEAVFELLRGVQQGQSKIGVEDDTSLWKIIKGYSEEEIPLHDAGFGLPIDVEFITIGAAHREYLVPFKLLEEKMKTIGCELVKPEGLRELGLANSTATFYESYKMAAKAGKKFAMGDAVKQFSFLNRWFIFKRTSDGTTAPASVVAAAAAEGAEGLTAAERAQAQEEGQAQGQPQGQPQGQAQPQPQATAGPDYRYAATEVINFYTDAGLNDKLGIKDPGFARYLAPSTYFSIPDQDDPKVTYPSLEYYIAAMKYKVATNKPEFAKTLFSRDGSLFYKYVNRRTEETKAGAKKLSDDREIAILKDETVDIRKETTSAGFKRNKAVFNEVAWNEQQDALLRYAMTYRYDKDPRYRKIIEAARAQHKYLLYYTPSGAASELGGRRRANDNRIEGQNKIGKMMMEIAGFV
jgi:hypothetical protein